MQKLSPYKEAESELDIMLDFLFIDRKKDFIIIENIKLFPDDFIRARVSCLWLQDLLWVKKDTQIILDSCKEWNKFDNKTYSKVLEFFARTWLDYFYLDNVIEAKENLNLKK